MRLSNSKQCLSPWRGDHEIPKENHERSRGKLPKLPGRFYHLGLEQRKVSRRSSAPGKNPVTSRIHYKLRKINFISDTTTNIAGSPLGHLQHDLLSPTWFRKNPRYLSKESYPERPINEEGGKIHPQFHELRGRMVEDGKSEKIPVSTLPQWLLTKQSDTKRDSTGTEGTFNMVEGPTGHNPFDSKKPCTLSGQTYQTQGGVPTKKTAKHAEAGDQQNTDNGTWT